jgi:hypothetical protein
MNCAECDDCSCACTDPCGHHCDCGNETVVRRGVIGWYGFIVILALIFFAQECYKEYLKRVHPLPSELPKAASLNVEGPR